MHLTCSPRRLFFFQCGPAVHRYRDAKRLDTPVNSPITADRAPGKKRIGGKAFDLSLSLSLPLTSPLLFANRATNSKTAMEFQGLHQAQPRLPRVLKPQENKHQRGKDSLQYPVYHREAGLQPGFNVRLQCFIALTQTALSAPPRAEHLGCADFHPRW